MNWPWEALGLPGPAELSEIRKAYAEKLKTTRPEDDPEAFQRLHDAYQAARRLSGQGGASGRETKAASDNPQGAEADASRPESAEAEISRPGDAKADTGRPGSAEAEAKRLGNAKTAPRTWDFERLFAEGEAEERGRRFQKLVRLREKNQSRYDAWKPSPTRDPAETALVWMAIFHAASLMEDLSDNGADAALWSLFCKSELFLYVRDCPDFVFALEDFLRERPELPQAAYLALFRAYRFHLLPVREEYAPLYGLLKENLPERPPTSVRTCRENPTRRLLRWFLALILLTSALNLCADALAEEDRKAEQVRAWMAEDFGHEFVRAEQWPWEPLILFDAETETYFRAAWDGSRDTAQGQKGYVSDYAEARMSQAVAAFADEWHYTVFPRYEAGNLNAGRGDWSASYLQIPLTGAGDGITALGNLLSALSAADWRQQSPPDFRLYLGWRNWSFCEYDAQKAAFDAPALRQYYERNFGADLCRIALRGTGVARADIGNSFVLVPDAGTAQVGNRAFFHVTGFGNPALRPLYHYLLSDDGAELFCASGKRKISELTLQELYRMDSREYEVKGFLEPLTVFRMSADSEAA